MNFLKNIIHVPGYNYCGLGGDASKPPINNIDAACKRHDEAYERMGSNAYTIFTGADQRLMDSCKEHWKEDPATAATVISFFTMKKNDPGVMTQVKSLLNWASDYDNNMGVTASATRLPGNTIPKEKGKKSRKKQIFMSKGDEKLEPSQYPEDQGERFSFDEYGVSYEWRDPKTNLWWYDAAFHPYPKDYQYSGYLEDPPEWKTSVHRNYPGYAVNLNKKKNYKRRNKSFRKSRHGIHKKRQRRL